MPASIGSSSGRYVASVSNSNATPSAFSSLSALRMPSSNRLSSSMTARIARSGLRRFAPWTKSSRCTVRRLRHADFTSQIPFAPERFMRAVAYCNIGCALKLALHIFHSRDTERRQSTLAYLRLNSPACRQRVFVVHTLVKRSARFAHTEVATQRRHKRWYGNLKLDFLRDETTHEAK